MSLYWKTCPLCDRRVYIVDHRWNRHLKPPLKRRWPKWPEECPMGGNVATLDEPEPVALEM